MLAVEIIRQPSDAERQRLIEFVDELTVDLGERPLSDHLWLDLNKGGGGGFVAVTVADAAGILGLAQISAAHDSSSLELALRPALPTRRRLHDDLFETAVDAFRHEPGGRLYWWVDDPGDQDAALADRLGFIPERELYEMGRTLPLDQSAAIATRSFVPGQDDAAWITVNNRAFADHGEQGGWTPETLALRIAEPWFDADGFRLHERDGRLAGFCWTKLHADRHPVTGEIYVIAVDPDFHGQGLGKQLTIAGLDSITARGVSNAMLYVDAANVPAVALYESLGFTVQRRRRAFSADFTEATTAPGAP